MRIDANNKQFNNYNTEADFWRDNAVIYGTNEAIIICGNYLDTQLKDELSDDEKQFCREIFAAMYESTADKVFAAKLVYPYDFKTANDRAETSYYHKNRDMNKECTSAIDRAISASCYKTNHYHLELAAMCVICGYGFERVNAVLAYQIQKHESDGRYSSANKKWAKNFTLPDDKTYAFMNSHATLIDDFAAYSCKLYEELGAERFALPGHEEHGEIIHGYQIIRSSMFSENQGYAIAYNSNAADPYVCWQFTVENGQYDYYWGIYGDEKAAIDSYTTRLFVKYN